MLNLNTQVENVGQDPVGKCWPKLNVEFKMLNPNLQLTISKTFLIPKMGKQKTKQQPACLFVISFYLLIYFAWTLCLLIAHNNYKFNPNFTNLLLKQKMLT